MFSYGEFKAEDQVKTTEISVLFCSAIFVTKRYLVDLVFEFDCDGAKINHINLKKYNRRVYLPIYSCGLVLLK